MSLEWQEEAVRSLIHGFLDERYILGANPFDIESLIGRMVRDQYQGGSTVMTAIGEVEIALWGIVGKACGQPVYNLLGGNCRDRLPACANGWYGGARTADVRLSPGTFTSRAAAKLKPMRRGLLTTDSARSK